MSHCLVIGISKVWTKHCVRIIDIRSVNGSVLDHVISHHGFKVSLIWMSNNFLGLASNFGRAIFFLVENFKIILHRLYKGHVLGFWCQYMVDLYHIY